MRIFTNKGWARERKFIEEMVESDYKTKALALNFIGTIFGKDFSSMSCDEIESFFNYCSADEGMLRFLEGMEAGTDCMIEILEKCGLTRKRTLEKLRFRALKNIEVHKEEYKKRIEEDSPNAEVS